ncbi:uncharacterized protein LOC141904363 [Tubulanus polymorphus]|uniref:uncharacterized protein LOC141904363 n=1 Tax=Tubulanus polymorphus TaxID=672921 RepID=UPI003DA2446E
MPGDVCGNADVIVQFREGGLKKISNLHRSYDPLHYVLLFPYGTDGWQLGLKTTDNKTLTALDFYSYRLHVRKNDSNILMKSRRLLQQYAVDQWAKIEMSRLQWAKLHQKTIRAEKYQGLHDAIQNGDVMNPGKKIILPPTIYGSPRFYSEAFQNAMTIVRYIGRPDYFITFTTNPKWPEIVESLNPGERAHDRPDIAVRVFKLKFDSLMDDLLKKHVLGRVKAHTATIEWQKRGLSHAHILLIMDNDDKPRTPEIIDQVVSAEIPDIACNPRLHKIITANNIHGPCGTINPGNPCMDGIGVSRRCTRDFPKMFSQRTVVHDDNYPVYRRRSPDQGGYRHTIRIRGADFDVDNSFVVPYNPLLSLRYDAHINVEVVHSIQAVKYLYKYITKGQDKVIVSSDDGSSAQDEISTYLNARYISASEAFWKIYGFPIHQKYPPVEKLPCHLSGEQTVLFQASDAATVVENGPPTTKLTAFFQMNAEDETSRTILYPEFPRYFTWNTSGKKWQRRKRGTVNANGEITTDVLGRIPTISLSAHQTELYFLRMLLHHRAGATSYEDLRTINGELCPTFQDACMKLGLITDDGEIYRAMEEASNLQFGSQLRNFFATLLIYCRPSDPLQFWNKWRTELSRDIMHQMDVDHVTARVENEVLLQLQHAVQREGLDLALDFSLPLPVLDSVTSLPRVISEETSYDMPALHAALTEKLPTLNDEQKLIYDAVIGSLQNDEGKLFCINASGGTGKTYLLNVILTAARCNGFVALGTALSGIASTLLDNGRTLHSRCKIPINVKEDSTCNISNNTATADLLRRTTLLVIDEVSMGNKHTFECLDRSLQDIRQNPLLFGGLTVVFAGDWRQILPVVRHGSRPQIVDATLKRSYIWPHVKMLQLTQNMRLQLSDDQDFPSYLMSIGNGTTETFADIGPNTVTVPDHLSLPTNRLDDLCDFVFGDSVSPDSLCSKAIIAPTNKAVEKVNNRMISKFSGTQREYLSSDAVLENEHQYPLEFIHSLNPSGLPPHKLILKQNCPIMLLRNLDPAHGHCNGTRYIITHLHDHVIEAVIATGVHARNRLFIPRIPMAPSDTLYPFQMQRRQFPIKLAFGITANKSQGQTLNRVGIYLPTSFFSHGQLYVAMSRVTSCSNLKLLCTHKPNDENCEIKYTDNVVYKEIL